MLAQVILAEEFEKAGAPTGGGNAAPYAIGRVVGSAAPGAPSLVEALAFAVPLFYAMSAVGFAATSVVTERWERAKNN